MEINQSLKNIGWNEEFINDIMNNTDMGILFKW